MESRRIPTLRLLSIIAVALVVAGCPRFAYLELHNFSGQAIEVSIPGERVVPVGTEGHVRLRAGARDLQVTSPVQTWSYTLLIPHGGENGRYFDGTLRVRLNEDGALIALSRDEDPVDAEGEQQPEGFPLLPAMLNCAFQRNTPVGAGVSAELGR